MMKETFMFVGREELLEDGLLVWERKGIRVKTKSGIDKRVRVEWTA